MPNIVVYDLETTGLDTGKVFPIQFAALPVDGVTLKIKEDNVFNQMCRPPDFDDMVKFKDESGNITDTSKYGLWKFHAEHRGVTIEQVIDLVAGSPPMNLIFEQFKQFISSFSIKGEKPVLAGFNIVNYDNIIINRLLEGKKGPWNPIYFLDTMQLCYTWLRSKGMRSMSLDTLRGYFGLSKGGHEALKDCKDTALILTRFLNFQQQLAISKNYFENTFKV